MIFRLRTVSLIRSAISILQELIQLQPHFLLANIAQVSWFVRALTLVQIV